MLSAIDVLLPGLCGPLPKHAQPTRTEPLQRLAQTLGASSAAAGSDYLSQLAAVLGLDTIPVASLLLAADSDEHLERHCIVVEPVHLKADMDHALLIDAHSVGVSANERRQLLATLNAHFDQDGIEIIETSTGDWVLCSAGDPGLETVPLDQVIARNVNLFLPRGERAVEWKRFLNEAQMLLHTADSNQRRMESGLLPLNSLWLWGESAPLQRGDFAAIAARYDCIVGDSALHAGLARLAGIGFRPLVDCDAATLADRVLLCDTSLQRPAAAADMQTWTDGLERLLDQRIQPLLERARRDAAELTVYPCNGHSYRPGRRSWLDRFRKPGIDKVLCYDD